MKLVPATSYRDTLHWRHTYPPAMAYWQRVRTALRDRSGGICELCLQRPGTEAHHLTYKYLYHELDNLQSLVWCCHNCHLVSDDYRRKYGTKIVSEEEYLSTLPG